jgi:predicted AlkP superfamily phosphohydrolase/phosphomutase
VLPEFGRDQDLNQRNGLDHGDGSDCQRKVFLVAAGPDFARGKVKRTECATYDVCPTVLKLFGQPVPKMVGGKPIDDLFA